MWEILRGSRQIGHCIATSAHERSAIRLDVAWVLEVGQELKFGQQFGSFNPLERGMGIGGPE